MAALLLSTQLGAQNNVEQQVSIELAEIRCMNPSIDLPGDDRTWVTDAVVPQEFQDVEILNGTFVRTSENAGTFTAEAGFALEYIAVEFWDMSCALPLNS